MPRHLRAWRKLRGLTLEQVGNSLGVAHSTVQRWEERGVRISASDLEALARLYEASPRQLNAPPEVASLVEKLDQVQALVDDMSDDDFKAWLAIGERLKRR